MKPLVTIAMPVYNGAIYVREALDSLLAQTRVDFELIISDNASTDTTGQICREYAAQDSRISYIRQPINIGVLSNFQFVLKQARGEYFMWAAHDDRWSPNWLSELLAAHREHVVLTFGEVVAVNKDGEVIRSCRNLSFMGGLMTRSLRYAFQDAFEGKSNLFYGLFKTKVVTDVLREEQIGSGFAVDALMIFSVLQKGEISAVTGARLYKRVGGMSDEGSRNYPLISRITASYFVPYLFGYTQRASTLVLKCALFASLPLLLVRAQLTRLQGIVGRL